MQEASQGPIFHYYLHGYTWNKLRQTTSPVLSRSYSDSTGFVHFCDRLIAGDVRGSADTVPSSAFRVGSMAAKRSYRACCSSYLVHQCQIGERCCPSISTPVYTHQTTVGGLILCYFPIRPSPPTFIPCLVLSSHLSSPREEGSKVLPV